MRSVEEHVARAVGVIGRSEERIERGRRVVESRAVRCGQADARDRSIVRPGAMLLATGVLLNITQQATESSWS